MPKKRVVTYRASKDADQVWEDFQRLRKFKTKQQVYDFATEQLKRILEKRNYGNYGHDKPVDSTR